MLIDGSLFTWTGNHGTSEASTVFQGSGFQNQIQVRSPKTGTSRTFFASKNLSNKEGEFIGCEYKCAEGNLKVTVFNT